LFDPQQLSDLENLYEFRETGSARVAGRRVKVIDIAPRDSYRYGEDKSSGGVLHGASSMGGVHAYGVMRDQWHATVVGEVPLATVKMVAESLQISTQ